MALTQTGTDGIKDDAITLAKQAAGTDGQIITYDASGNPVAVGPGTDGQVLTSTGAGSPPAFEAIPTPVDATKTTLTGSTNNTITTVTGANAIQGEANLTFDGSDLSVTDTVSIKNATYLSSSSTITSRLTLNSDNTSSWTGTRELVALDLIGNGADHRTGTLSIKCKKLSGDSSPTEMVRVDGVHNLTKIISGNLDLGDGDLVIETAGHGINFHPHSGTANLLDDYEEGTFTVTDASASSLTITNEHSANYVKIGQFVYLQVDITYPSTSNTNDARFEVPFKTGILNYGGGQAGWTDLGRPAFGHVNTDGCYLMDNTPSNGKHLSNADCSGKRFIMQLTYKTTA